MEKQARLGVAEPTPWQGERIWTSVEGLTELILRKTMRVASAIGTLGMLSPLLFGMEFNARLHLLAGVAIVILFGLTLLPIRIRLLSVVYPWTMILIGSSSLWLTGPGATSFLLLAGGLFIGSLVFKTPALISLAATTAISLASIAIGGPWELTPDLAREWTEASITMTAIVLPVAVTARLLVVALASTLQERQRLFKEVIEERKTLQRNVATLERTRSQLTHAQKVELMSQMAGGIAHDMNNALTSIIGEASLLSDSVTEERERILEAGAHAAKLTQRLMVFGRQDMSRPRPLELSSTLATQLQSVRRLVPSDIEISTELSTERIVVIADPTQLLQIILNLAANARDAMPRGGKLSFELSLDERSEEASLVISDTGTGIDPETLEKVFDPFFTTKEPGKGTGLGLASVRQIVESMGGTIEATSELGEGTSFKLCLPTTETEVMTPALPEAGPNHQGGTILVVDDDIRVRAVAQTALQRMGYRVLEAGTVPLAVELARQHRDELDLLLTDVVMADGGGAEAIRSVRAEIPKLPVLVMSGYADDETVGRGLSQGEYPFLAKPFTSEQLSRAVAHALAQ